MRGRLGIGEGRSDGVLGGILSRCITMRDLVVLFSRPSVGEVSSCW